ncbi:MAG TPA: hypothetical protein VJN22_04765 [Candidatus Eremiobacteraceae bacterium]|nr:hypothetical protein [Candidatus Eremiobacteraceae bacterium]
MDRRPARELFQSLEVYLIRSGYEALAASPQDLRPPTGLTTNFDPKVS